DRGPAPAFARAHPDLAARRAEVHAHRIVRVGAHRLPLHGEPALLGREALVLAAPGPAAVARDVGRGLAARGDARPYGAAVHRKHPQRVGIARMQHQWETDVADRFRHRVADPVPALRRAFQAVYPAVILLVQTIGRERMQPHAVHVVAVLRVLDGKEIGRDALVERPPGLSAVRALERAADRDADVEMPGIARIDVDRVQRRAAGRPLLLLAADPDDAHRVGVEAGDAFPGDAAVIGAEQSRR